LKRFPDFGLDEIPQKIHSKEYFSKKGKENIPDKKEKEKKSKTGDITTDKNRGSVRGRGDRNRGSERGSDADRTLIINTEQQKKIEGNIEGKVEEKVWGKTENGGRKVVREAREKVEGNEGGRGRGRGRRHLRLTHADSITHTTGGLDVGHNTDHMAARNATTVTSAQTHTGAGKGTGKAVDTETWAQTWTHSGTQTDTQTDTQIDTQTDTQIDTQTDTQAEKQIEKQIGEVVGGGAEAEAEKQTVTHTETQAETWDHRLQSRASDVYTFDKSPDYMRSEVVLSVCVCVCVCVCVRLCVFACMCVCSVCVRV
jgi:hypothetical protein